MGVCSCRGTLPGSPRTRSLNQSISPPSPLKNPNTCPSKVDDIEWEAPDTTPEKPPRAKETKQKPLSQILEEPLLEEPLLEEPLLSTDTAEEKKRTPIVKYIVGLMAVALLGCGLYVNWGTVESWAKAAWLILLHLGLWAVPIWVVLLWVTTSVSGPSFFFELNGGVLFDQMYGDRKGAIIGMLTCSLGVWLGCVTSFAIGRRFLKQHVRQIIKDNRTLNIINEIVTEEGWKFSFLIRLNPLIPFEIFNYAIAMSDISFVENAIASIGTLQRVCFEVYLAVAGSQVAEDTEEGKPHLRDKIIHIAINVGMGVALIAATAIYAKRKFDAKMAKEAQSEKEALSVIRMYSTTSSLPGKMRRSITKNLDLGNVPKRLSRQVSSVVLA